LKKYKTVIDEIMELSPLEHLYEDGMEVQVMTTTSAFRITDKVPALEKENVKAIGLTGWNAVEHKTNYVTFDIDSFSNHKNGLSELELEDLLVKLEEIDFTNIYRSTSGKGYHVYVFFTDPIPASTRKEHIKISKYVRNKLNILLGGGFSEKVDVSGLVSWVWYGEKMNDKSFKQIKTGTTLDIDILSLLRFEDASNPVTKSKVNVELSVEHRAVMDWLNDNKCNWWWEDSKQLLIAHTLDLVKCHEELQLKGDFTTNTTGSTKHNCFLMPIVNGAWIVRRFGDVKEPDWTQKDEYWFTFFNKPLTLKEAFERKNGTETPSGAYMFLDLEQAVEALRLVNIEIDIPAWSVIREAKIRKKNGKLILEFRAEQNDRGDQLKGWIKETGNWKKIIGEDNMEEDKIDLSNVDNYCRYLLNPDFSDMGWFIYINNRWSSQTLTNVKHRLFTNFRKDTLVKCLIGDMIENAWVKVIKPFQEEFTGNREWNFGSKLRYTIGEESGSTPTWDNLFRHLGENIDKEAMNDLGISGKQYLLYWVVALLRNPEEPSAYLFFHGPQNSGKSMFHEALDLLFDRGYIKADKALTNQQGFNAEIESAVLCIIEETDLRNTQAYNRIKEWVTAKYISIHEKGKTPYMSQNFTHWIHCMPDSQWIMTDKGAKQIKELIDTPFTAIVNGKPYECKTGFFNTGIKEVFEIETVKGYKLQATEEHPIMCDFYDAKYDVKVGDLDLDTDLCLNNHNKLSWGLDNYSEGYILGWLVGDGTVFYRSDIELVALLYFYKDDYHICDKIEDLFTEKVKVNIRADGAKTISGKELSDLCYNYDLVNKDIIPEKIEQESSQFYKGFLSALFDADGSVVPERHTVILYQSNLSILESVQRMLLRLGIVSQIYKCRDAGKVTILGKICNNKISYSLSIRRYKNIKRFNDRVGLSRVDKQFKLDELLNSWKRKPVDEPYTTKVKTITSLGVENVYDCTIEDLHYFDCNGLVVHNCANSHLELPIFSGDTRITVIPVNPLKTIINKRELINRLRKEAQFFINKIYYLTMPEFNDRLIIPALTSTEKLKLESANDTPVEQFITEYCSKDKDSEILFSELYQKFLNDFGGDISRIMFGKNLPLYCDSDRRKKDNQKIVRGIKWI